VTKYRNSELGFTLLEMVCTLAIVALGAALALPAIPHATSSTRLGGYALEIAALLTADRYSAVRRRAEVATSLNPAMGTIQSGATDKTLRLPADVTFAVLVAENCKGRAGGAIIDFFASGMSCGGAIRLSRPGVSYQIRVNWLTGSVEVVKADPSVD
jgi:general secretion pathway protein H